MFFNIFYSGKLQKKHPNVLQFGDFFVSLHSECDRTPVSGVNLHISKAKNGERFEAIISSNNNNAMRAVHLPGRCATSPA